MLLEKEVIRDGVYCYIDQKTGLPKKLTVTPELRKHWHDTGNAMLSDKLPIPVPYEHDFNAHPMAAKEALLNNAGEVKQFRLDGNKLLSTVNITDSQVAKKIDDKSVRWTSPWFNSFVDGNGKEWKNVISHLALTTRPRVVEQDSFVNIAAALSVATEVTADVAAPLSPETTGYCLSPAGLLGTRKSDKQLAPRYPVAFSLLSGVPLSDDNFTSKKKAPPKKKDSGKDGGGEGNKKSKKPESDGGKPDSNPTPNEKDEFEDGGDDEFESDAIGGDGDDKGKSTNINDVSMEELLCDLLGALGINCEHSGNEEMFKRELYNAAMTKIHELTAKGQADPNKPQGNRTNPPGQPPNKQNPLINQIQQEQQPMYMGLGGKAMEFSLEEINKLPDPMRGVALAMYTENQKLRGELDSNKKVTDSLRDAKLKEATDLRTSRVTLLGRLSPSLKVDLDAMLALPSMALSMGDGGTVVDPMNQTLAMLEKGLADIPRLLTTDRTALSIAPHPTDATELTDARSSEIADGLSRQMGYAPQAKAS